MIRLAVLGLVVGLASATMAGEGCGSCGDSDSGAKKKSTNNVTPSDQKELLEKQKPSLDKFGAGFFVVRKG